MRPAILAIASLVASLGCAPRAAVDADTASVRQAGAPNDVASVQRAIDSAEARFNVALMKGDVATIASLYADDAVILAPGMKAARGPAERMAMHKAMLAGVSYPAVALQSEDLIVTGDYAIETGSYRMTIQPAKGKAMEDVGKFVSVWKKQADGSWKMIRDIANTDLAAR
jgi:uncharacterized protein (TIGR02246 family)